MTVTPASISDRTNSSYAAHVTGKGFTGWGATIGFNLRNKGGDQPYDASQFKAMTFFAKGKMTGNVRVAIRMQSLADSASGGNCDTASGNCFAYHGAELTITESWQQFRLVFSEIKREGDKTGDFDPKTIVGVEFRFLNANDPFELWIDDVSFATE
jgi:hypothetical protein